MPCHFVSCAENRSLNFVERVQKNGTKDDLLDYVSLIPESQLIDIDCINCSKQHTLHLHYI